MSTGDITRTEQELEHELAGMLDIERFDPPESFRSGANLADPAIYEQADADWQGWWVSQAQRLTWFKQWDQVLDDSNPPFYKWFVGGKLNVSYNCLDRHVEAGRGDRVAYHWHGEEGEEQDITYADLLARVQKFSNALLDLSVKKGDVVGIYLGMIPEVVVSMLACARIGAVHNVVFGGFSAESVRERMEFSEAKVLITADGAARKGKVQPVKHNVDEVMGDLPHLEHIIVVRSKGTACEMRPGRDVWFHEIVAAAAAACPAEPMDAEDPLFILYTSGSTAKPKGILHTTGGYLTGASSTHQNVFDIHADTDVWWCCADVGWVTGHTYIVYGPLANGTTGIMYEGAPDYPHRGIWWELVERYKATIFYTAPTAIRACVKWGVEHVEKFDLSSLRLLGTVGEPINPKAWLWYHKVIGGGRCPIVDTWWQTETGSIMISPLPGIVSTKPGSATRALPGVLAEVVDEHEGQARDRGPGTAGAQAPVAVDAAHDLQGGRRFVETYFRRFGSETYLVGDAARKDKDGYFWIIGRIDDVVNVSGHRLSTAEVESAIVACEAVAESAVIGQSDELTGQAITAFVTLQGDTAGSADVEELIRAEVAERIGKFARPKRIIFADDLPKTRSGKIMRRLLRDIAEGRALGDVTTLRDPSVMATLEHKIQAEHAAEG